jgi:acyl-CoA thioesterase YciA
MSQMDLAAGNLASRTSHGRCVTVSADAMSFLRPVKIGDEVSVYCTLVSTGRTSMKINVEAWRRARIGEEEYRVTRATFTFVAIDAEGKPRPITSPSFFEKKGAPPGEAKKLLLHAGSGRTLPAPPGPKVFCFFFSKKKRLLSNFYFSVRPAELVKLH